MCLGQVACIHAACVSRPRSTRIIRVTGLSRPIGARTAATAFAVRPFIISRVSLPAMVALGVGGYVAKRFMDKNTAEQATKPTPPTAPVQQ